MKPNNYSKDLARVFARFFNQFKYPVMVIYGNPESGKTDTSLLIAEIGLKEGYLDYFASNINTYGYGERITNLEDLDFWLKNQMGRKLFILDEAGIHDDSRNPLAKLNKKIRHEVFVMRKFDAKIIFVLQELMDLDKWKNSELTGMKIKKVKVDKNYFIARISSKFFYEPIEVNPMPRTVIPFNSKDISPFTLEREIEENEVKLKGLPYQVAYYYAKYGNLAIVQNELKKITGKEWKWQQVKRLLQKYLREQLRIEVKRGRPRKRKGGEISV